MKCPHCGIEIRDTMTVCMYCGGKIPRRKGTPPPIAGKVPEAVTRSASRPAGAKQATEGDEEEEEGGLSSCLQPGEQVLIGSLNVSVKKFFFQAYLTNQRIFLIDTQEKKLKVTAKDIPLDTITETSVEFSENSDPVLVLAIRSADDEIKTLKLVFAGNGMDRSGEVDEWIELLQEQSRPKKQKKPALVKRPEPELEVPEETRNEPEEEIIPSARMPGSAHPQDLHPPKRPVKELERQPPVKRLLSLYKTPPEEEEEEISPAPARVHPKASPAPGPVRKTIPQQPSYREIPPVNEIVGKTVKKVEVQSAMKGAMKGALEPLQKTPERPSRHPVVTTTVKKASVPQPEPGHTPARADDDQPLPEEDEVVADKDAGPLFCQNCGKKLPSSANFCPGCGTKIPAGKDKQVQKSLETGTRDHQGETGEPAHDKHPTPTKHPVKKTPKGSEMTILHKFLRR